MPTHLEVVDGFRAPTCMWCAGNRGIDYATVRGQPVEAAAGGTVSFAGRVAGVTYVVVRTSRGVLVTHGGLGTAALRQGAVVSVGDALGAAGDTLYIGVRVGGVYVDPQRCSLTHVRIGPRAVLVGS